MCTPYILLNILNYAWRWNRNPIYSVFYKLDFPVQHNYLSTKTNKNNNKLDLLTVWPVVGKLCIPVPAVSRMDFFCSLLVSRINHEQWLGKTGIAFGVLWKNVGQVCEFLKKCIFSPYSGGFPQGSPVSPYYQKHVGRWIGYAIIALTVWMCKRIEHAMILKRIKRLLNGNDEDEALQKYGQANRWFTFRNYEEYCTYSIFIVCFLKSIKSFSIS